MDQCIHISAIYYPTSSDLSAGVIKTANQIMTPTSSALEHELWEEIVLRPGVSTTRVLHAAYAEGVPVHTINSSNVADLQKVDLRSIGFAAVSISQDIAAGRTIIIPERPVRVNNWTGLGWDLRGAGWNWIYLYLSFQPLIRLTPPPPASTISGGQTTD